MKKRIIALVAVMAFSVVGLTHAESKMTKKIIDTTNAALNKTQKFLNDVKWFNFLDPKQKDAALEMINKRIDQMKGVLRKVEGLSKDQLAMLEKRLEQTLDPVLKKLEWLKENIKKGDFKVGYANAITLMNKIKNERIPELMELLKDPEVRKAISKHFVENVKNTVDQMKRTFEAIKNTQGRGEGTFWQRVFGF